MVPEALFPRSGRRCDVRNALVKYGEEIRFAATDPLYYHARTISFIDGVFDNDYVTYVPLSFVALSVEFINHVRREFDIVVEVENKARSRAKNKLVEGRSCRWMGPMLIVTIARIWHSVKDRAIAGVPVLSDVIAGVHAMMVPAAEDLAMDAGIEDECTSGEGIGISG